MKARNILNTQNENNASQLEMVNESESSRIPQYQEAAKSVFDTLRSKEQGEKWRNELVIHRDS